MEVGAIKSAHRKDMEAQQKKAQDQLSEARTQSQASCSQSVIMYFLATRPSRPSLWCPADKQMYSIFDRSQCFASVPALTVDDESLN